MRRIGVLVALLLGGLVGACGAPVAAPYYQSCNDWWDLNPTGLTPDQLAVCRTATSRPAGACCADGSQCVSGRCCDPGQACPPEAPVPDTSCTCY